MSFPDESSARVSWPQVKADQFTRGREQAGTVGGQGPKAGRQSVTQRTSWGNGWEERRRRDVSSRRCGPVTTRL